MTKLYDKYFINWDEYEEEYFDWEITILKQCGVLREGNSLNKKCCKLLHFLDNIFMEFHFTIAIQTKSEDYRFILYTKEKCSKIQRNEINDFIVGLSDMSKAEKFIPSFESKLIIENEGTITLTNVKTDFKYSEKIETITEYESWLWLEENIKNRYWFLLQHREPFLIFENEEDAILYKLRWIGEDDEIPF